VNGIFDTSVRETRSDPHTVKIEKGTILLKYNNNNNNNNNT